MKTNHQTTLPNLKNKILIRKLKEALEFLKEQNYPKNMQESYQQEINRLTELIK